MEEKVPQVYAIGEYTYVDAKVKLNPGLWAHPAAKIAHYLVCERKVEQDVFIGWLNKLDENTGTRQILPQLEKIASAKNIMSLITLEIARDCDARIFVEGKDIISRDLALNIYSALTAEKEYLDNNDFERFRGR